MTVRANINRKFMLRLGLIAVACCSISLWFLYDGTIGYPRQRERALKYIDLQEADRLDDEWDQIAEERGWPTKYPGKPKEEAEIYVQLVIATVSAIPGLLYAFFFLRAYGKWIEANETGLTTSWRQQFEFGQIEWLDKGLWRTKGIARIVYDQNGRKRRLALDDWKYDADPTKAILLAVESRLDDEQIVGGPPEPPAEDESEDQLQDQAVETDSTDPGE